VDSDYYELSVKGYLPTRLPAPTGAMWCYIANKIFPDGVPTQGEGRRHRCRGGGVISSASGMERGEVFYRPTDWLGSRDPMTPGDYAPDSSSGLDD
jgi:hypothetical protein